MIIYLSIQWFFFCGSFMWDGKAYLLLLESWLIKIDGYLCYFYIDLMCLLRIDA